MRDLSEEGFSVRVMIPLHAGEKTPFSFSLSASERVEGEGKILWVEENGRVAAVQFTQISAENRALIRDWLKRPVDVKESREATPTPPAPAIKTPEQLRQELQSVPAREEQPVPDISRVAEKAAEAFLRAMESRPSLPPQPNTSPAPPLTVPAEKAVEPIIDKGSQAAPIPEPPPVAPSQPEVPSALHLVSPIEKPTEPTVERAAETHSIPDLPRLILPRIDLSVEAPAPAEPAARSASHGEGPVKSAEPALMPESEEAGRSVAQPDISSILIQPSGKHDQPAPQSARWNALPSLDTIPARPDAGRRTHFTLTTAVTIMCILALVLSVFVYHRAIGSGLIWLGEQMGGQGRSVEPVTPNNRLSASPPSEPPSKTAASDERGTENAVTPSGKSSAVTAIPNTAAPPVTALPGIAIPSNGGSQEPGQAEYVQAVDLLRGNNAGGDVRPAVRLLWVAVEKGNPGAEIVLADMYWHGQGVVKNCDQTRILLTAAARKGSAEAKKRLQQFQQAGCE